MASKESKDIHDKSDVLLNLTLEYSRNIINQIKNAPLVAIAGPNIIQVAENTIYWNAINALRQNLKYSADLEKEYNLTSKDIDNFFNQYVKVLSIIKAGEEKGCNKEFGKKEYYTFRISLQSYSPNCSKLLQDLEQCLQLTECEKVLKHLEEEINNNQPKLSVSSSEDSDYGIDIDFAHRK
ncbi:MAG: hypothetical protein V1934_05610 [Methanobacteriota archaeon]